MFNIKNKSKTYFVHKYKIGKLINQLFQGDWKKICLLLIRLAKDKGWLAEDKRRNNKYKSKVIN